MRASEKSLSELRAAMERLGIAKWSIAQVDENFASAGYPDAPPVLVAPGPVTEDLVTVHNAIPAIVLEVERAARWRELALQLAALIYVKRGKNESFCNVCGMVNMHLPTCLLHPFLVHIRDLVVEESSDLRV